MTITLGTPEDVDAAITVFVAAESARRGSPVTDDEVERMTARLRAGGWPVLAWDGHEVVGVAVGFSAREDDGAGPELVPGLAHLSIVMVLPERWGEGVGGRLLEGVLAETRRRGFERIQLWTHEDNQRGQALYRRRGFVPAGRTKDDERGERIGLWAREL